MTPKSKAKELFKKYSKGKDKHGWSLCEWDSGAKECALISVDDILKELYEWGEVWMKRRFDYWQEVKQEIEKL